MIHDKEKIEKKRDGAVIHDDGKTIRIDEQRDKIKGIKLGTNQKPNKPKPESVESE